MCTLYLQRDNAHLYCKKKQTEKSFATVGLLKFSANNSLFVVTKNEREHPLFFLCCLLCRTSYRARRKPRLLLRLSGVLLLRFDTRQFLALLFQLPPRFTRLEPYGVCSFLPRHLVHKIRCRRLVYECQQTRSPFGIFFL